MASDGYSWEEAYKRSWDALKEDESGSLNSAVRHLQKNQHAFYKSLRLKER